jgi:hypothetical protein
MTHETITRTHSLSFLLILCLIGSSMIMILGEAEGAPTADFSISGDTVIVVDSYQWKTYVGDPITFDAGSSTQTESYHWDFGDETTVDTTASTQIHTYHYVESYPVLLEVEDDEGTTDTLEGSITAIEKPFAVFRIRDSLTGEDLGANPMVSVGQELLFDGRDSRGEIFSYRFGYYIEKNFSSQLNPSGPSTNHIYTASGVYKAGMQVVDTLGNTSTTPRSEYIIVTVVGGEEDNDSGIFFSGAMLGTALTILGVVAILMFIANSRVDRVTTIYDAMKSKGQKPLPPVIVDGPSNGPSSLSPGSHNQKQESDPYHETILPPPQAGSPWSGDNKSSHDRTSPSPHGPHTSHGWNSNSPGPGTSAPRSLYSPITGPKPPPKGSS